MKNQKGFIPILIVLLVTILAIVGGAYYFGYLKYSNPVNKANVQNTVTNTNPISSQGQIFSGHIQRLSQNLGLFLTASDFNNPSKLDQVDNSITYYSAGTYTSGKYSGYTRYIALKQEQRTAALVFASKDGETFIYDGTPDDNEYTAMDIHKVTAFDKLPLEHPANIPLNATFALSRNSIVTSLVPTSQKDQNGNQVYQSLLVSDFASFPTLNSPISNLKLYQKLNQKSDQQNTLEDGTYYNNSSIQEAAQGFIDGTTTTFAVDSTGLTYTYSLSTPQLIASYPKALDEFNKASAVTRQDPSKPYPDYPQPPDLRLPSQNIQTSSSIYSKYNIAMPTNCAQGGDTLIAKNINDNDLQKIGTSPFGDIYVLRDKNHALNQAQYQVKIGWALSKTNDSLTTFKQVNNDQNPPSFNDYLNKNPLVFFKDYWGRWVMLGEFDYKLLGGCGKPVVYLYPPKPTTVNVQFLTPISFDLTIPEYKGGWKVLAYPNGTLTDLQPQFTDCNAIDTTKLGSEYAKHACQNNSYPYLYWAGNSTQRSYPTITKGWIVSSNNLSTFMNGTLDKIGFNSTEKSDFLSYWIPEMLTHNAPYYSISFLQNPEMDEIAPMKITPAPDHYYRYFLDYLPLNSKPNDIQPEDLTKIIRGGFTLVEWGGRLLY